MQTLIARAVCVSLLHVAAFAALYAGLLVGLSAALRAAAAVPEYHESMNAGGPETLLMLVAMGAGWSRPRLLERYTGMTGAVLLLAIVPASILSAGIGLGVGMLFVGLIPGVIVVGAICVVTSVAVAGFHLLIDGGAGGRRAAGRMLAVVARPRGVTPLATGVRSTGGRSRRCGSEG